MIAASTKILELKQSIAIYPNLSYSVARDMAPIMFTRHHIIEVMAEVNCMASRASSITCMSALLMRSASQKGPSR